VSLMNNSQPRSRWAQYARISCPECGGPLTWGHAVDLLFEVPPVQRNRVLHLIQLYGQKRDAWLCSLCESWGIFALRTD